MTSFPLYNSIKKCYDKNATVEQNKEMYYYIKWNYNDREIAQLGRALAWGARGRRFESCFPD